MATSEWNETRIRSLIKDVLRQELKDIKRDIQDLKDKQKTKTDDEKVREIVRQTIVNMYKFFWQKSSTYIKQI